MRKATLYPKKQKTNMRPSTNQHYELVCLGTEEDAVGADSFPKFFVNVVARTAVDDKKDERGSGAGKTPSSASGNKKAVKKTLTCPSGPLGH